MNDSLFLIDITSELGLYLKDSISLFNDYINSGEIKYKIYKIDNFVYIDIIYSSEKIEISSIFYSIFESELTLDNVDSKTLFHIPYIPYRSAIFVFQLNNKEYITTIHTISCTSKYVTVKFIVNLEK